MSLDVTRTRELMQPRWDASRERNVLERALAARGRRGRRWRVLAWSSAIATAVVLLRIMPLYRSDGAPPSTPAVHPSGADPSTAFPPFDSTDGGGRAG